MASQGDLPLLRSQTSRTTSYSFWPLSYLFEHESRRHTTPTAQDEKLNPKEGQCYDWIFSSATNVHIAIDRSAFTSYTPFDSYVLTLANQNQIPVKGIGVVELKLRCRPGSRDATVIILEDVLHIPTWLCNIFSDIYLRPTADFEHTWSDFGLNIVKKDAGEVSKAWAYTENFCGLDRLVLKHKSDGRSPMLQDKDREIFSINVAWPQSQKEKWSIFLADAMKDEAEKGETQIIMACHQISG